MKSDPARYHAWYAGPRGAWMGAREVAVVQDLLPLEAGASLLDVGCGTGFFSSRFADAGLRVTGLDANPAMLDFARQRDGRIEWQAGQAETLPFADGQFDYATAMTSLCFVAQPAQAVQELWRISRRAVLLGLLHRHSLLYWQKRHALSYQSARWDTLTEARAWAETLQPSPRLDWRYALFLPSANALVQRLDTRLPPRLSLGGFLAVALYHDN